MLVDPLVLVLPFSVVVGQIPASPPALPCSLLVGRRRGISCSNKGKGRGLSEKIVTQLNSAADCGLIQEKLRDLDAIVFSFIAII